MLFKFVMNFVFGESLFKSLSAPKAYVMIDCIVYVLFFLCLKHRNIHFLYPIFIFCFATQYKRKTMQFITIFMCFCFLAKSKLRHINGTTAGSAETEYYTRNFAQKVLKWSEIVCVRVFLFSCIIYFWNLTQSMHENLKNIL